MPSSGGGEVAIGAGDAPVVDTTAGERVVICKYVRKPYVAEIPSHVIVVNEQALVGRGFPGTFPWAFSDAHFHSVAIRWAAAGEQAREVSLEECPTAPTGGGGTGGSTGGSGFGNETVQPPLRPSWQVERPESAPVPTGSLPTVSGLPQTGAPSGLEALLLLSSTALLAGVALRVHARRALP